MKQLADKIPTDKSEEEVPAPPWLRRTFLGE